MRGRAVERSSQARRRADEVAPPVNVWRNRGDHARARADARRPETGRESEAYALAVRDWSERLRISTGAFVNAVPALVAQDIADGPLPAQTPNEVAEEARSVVDPWLRNGARP